MQPIPFIASSAEEAVAQIRERLGPEAVVLNVRPLPANGIARLWQKPMIEVLAFKPEPAEAPAPIPPPAPAFQPAPLTDALAEFRQQLDEIRQKIDTRPAAEREVPAFREHLMDARQSNPQVDLKCGTWQVGNILQKSGLHALHAQLVLDQLCAEHGELAPASLAEQIALTRLTLERLWPTARPLAQQSMHILVGPAGSGKTTCLCKWLTQTALVEGRLAKVWRLDGATANMAESLSVYCDILGLPCERAWQPDAGGIAEDIGFIDLPGVDWRKPMAIKELSSQIKRFGTPQVHLVLNGAYDCSILMAQIRAFSELPIADLIITHLDEENAWGKLWNLVLGTNYSIRHFSTGQNIPGDFCVATADAVLARQFSRK